MTGQTLHLELEVTGENLSGRVSAGGGEATAFDGWLGLLSVLNALVDQAAGAASDCPEATTVGPKPSASR